MTVSLANEPLKAFQDAVKGITSLMTALSNRARRDLAPDVAGFPSLGWTLERSAAGPTDAEPWLYRDLTIQVNLYGTDLDLLEDWQLLVDNGLNDANRNKSMDSSHWRISFLRRTTPWQDISYPDHQTAEGNALIQRFSQWRMKALRKQSTP